MVVNDSSVAGAVLPKPGEVGGPLERERHQVIGQGPDDAVIVGDLDREKGEVGLHGSRRLRPRVGTRSSGQGRPG